jgi:hypothetical protein
MVVRADSRRFNMDPIGAYAAPTFSGLDLRGVPHTPLAPDAVVLTLPLDGAIACGDDIDGGGTLGEPTVTRVTASAAGMVDGVAFWFLQHLQGGGVIDSGPGAPGTAWRQAAAVLRPPVEVAVGDVLRLTASARGSHVAITLVME